MNRKLRSGTMAGLAAIALATGGSTFAAFDDESAVPGNIVGAGILQLDLSRSGSAGAALSFTDLKPGIRTSKMLWVAANDARSAVPATLTVTVRHLVDVPGSCDISTGKAEGEITSGITGCVITPNGFTGTPSIGTASRMLAVSETYDPSAQKPTSCAADTATTRSLLPIAGPGNLNVAANANGGAGTTVPIVDSHGSAVGLAPGRGVCIAVSAYWPPSVTDPSRATPEHPVDNAAQGDSFTVEVSFDLTQVAQ